MWNFWGLIVALRLMGIGIDVARGFWRLFIKRGERVGIFGLDVV